MKIWLDFCEPKSVIMLRPLYNRLIADHEVFITARDFDSTYALMDEWGVPYYKIGNYGGADLMGKLRSYADRLKDLIDVVDQEKPDFLFCITSPEAIRVAFGIKLPHIMFNDEPRSYGCSALTLPFVQHVIVPKPIPIEWYLPYGIPSEKIVQFNGIDEVAWLNKEDFTPSSQYAQDLGLDEGQYIVCRTEATQSYAHLEDRMQSHETLLTEVIPQLRQYFDETNQNLKILILTRYQEQFDYLSTIFASEIDTRILILRQHVAHLADIMYYAALVLSGGGTMVRESALLGIPSIEFIPTETYPQEQFLMENGFPLVHKKTVEEIIESCKNYLENPSKIDTHALIDNLENPILIGLNLFKQKMNLE
jgi:hypothetical protein